MAYQLNIRNPSNTSWINLLEAKYHPVEDTPDNFNATNVEDILNELYITKAMGVNSIADPNTGDYLYPIGTIWTNTVSSISFICVDNTISFASWKQITTMNSVSDITDIVGDMVTDNTEKGIDVTYDPINYKLDFDVHDPVITLSGDITGSGILTDLSDLTINTTGDFYNSAESDDRYLKLTGGILTGSLNIQQYLSFGGTTSVNTINNDHKISYDPNTLLTEKAIKDINYDNAWANPVTSMSFSAPYTSGAPVSGAPNHPPYIGERFIVKEPGTGDWVSYDNKITEWTGTEWLLLPLHLSSTVYVTDEARYYMFSSGDEWVNILQDTNIEVVDELGYFTFDYLDGVLNELYMMTGGPSGSIPTGLELLNENSQIGWRLIGRNTNYYGDIGQDAVDISYSNTSGDYGSTGLMSFCIGTHNTALGEASFASGNNTESLGLYSCTLGNGTRARGLGCTALGRYNDGVSYDTVLEVGVGSSDGSRYNGFEVYANGEVLAPELDLSSITENRSLITKEYFDTNTPVLSTGLERITEGANSGWRLVNEDPYHHGDIGEDAIDLTTQPFTNDYGATGQGSFAVGGTCRAVGAASISMGNGCTANGMYSVTMGNNTLTNRYNCVALGSHNIGHTDSVFEIGVGFTDASRENIIEILDDGTTTLPQCTNSDIISRGGRVLITKEYLDEELPNPNLVINSTKLIGGNSGTYSTGQFVAKRWEVTNDGTFSINVVNSDVDPVLTLYNQLILKQRSESISEYRSIDAPVVVSVTWGNIYVNGHNVIAGNPWVTTANSLGLDGISIGNTNSTSTYRGFKIEYGTNDTPFVGPWMDYESEMIKSNVVYP